MGKIVIAIDGFSGCGKSSTAKAVAKKLGYTYIDSGAMYRAATLHFLNNHIVLSNPKEVNKALDSLKINFLPLLFLGLLKVIESSNLIGKEINLLEFRENAISDFLPTKGKISERLDFDKNKNWLLIELENQMEYEGKKIGKVLIKNKDAEKSIKLKEKNQIAHLRLVTDESKLLTKELTQFPFIDWIRCE